MSNFGILKLISITVHLWSKLGSQKQTTDADRTIQIRAARPFGIRGQKPTCHPQTLVTVRRIGESEKAEGIHAFRDLQDILRLQFPAKKS